MSINNARMYSVLVGICPAIDKFIVKYLLNSVLFEIVNEFT